MLTIERCRELLGEDAAESSDADVGALRDLVSLMAEGVLDSTPTADDEGGRKPPTPGSPTADDEASPRAIGSSKKSKGRRSRSGADG